MRKNIWVFILWSLIQGMVGAQEKHILIKDTTDTNSITKTVFDISEVEVTAKLTDANLKSGSTGLAIDVKQLKLLPKFVGESDPYKALQYMGGVSQAGEASSGLYVRGGNNDQNLILFNGSLIQNPTHVLGMFSVFNPDLISEMRFIKSGMPAEYGGRLSSVVDIKTSNILPEKIKVDGSIGLISSRISAQIPIKTNFSIYASWRGSYISSIIFPLIEKLGIDSTLTQNNYEFWDANGGFIFRLSEKTKLTGHFYTGKDNLSVKEIKKIEAKGSNVFWDNTAAGVELNHIFNENASFNQQLNYSKFHIQSSFEWYNSKQKIRSQFENFLYKAEFLNIMENHKYKYGTELTYNIAKPHFVRSDSLLPIEIKNERNNIKAAQVTLFIRDEYAHKNWQFNVGVRSTLYAHLGLYTDFGEVGNVVYPNNDIIKKYWSFEPRFYSRYLLNPQSSIKFSVTRHVQFLNQVPVLSFGIPNDLQIPASLFVKPQGSWHFSGGYFRNFYKNDWETSFEVYYKSLENQLEFKNGIEATFNNSMFEKNLLTGKGWTYGAEWKISKNYGKFTGWISYNLAWSYRQFDMINNGIPYLAQNDRRHDISIIGMYELNKRWSFSSVLVYATGSRLNLPLSWYSINNQLVFEYGKYNAFELPPFHRIDVSANYKLKPWKKIESELNFSVYNAYNRANPYQVYFGKDALKDNKFNFHIRMAYLLPIIPSVSWTFHLN